MNLLDAIEGNDYYIDKTCEVEKFKEMGLYPDLKITISSINKFGIQIKIDKSQTKYAIKKDLAKCIKIKPIIKDNTFELIWRHFKYN